MDKKLLEENTKKRWKKLAGIREAYMTGRQARTLGPAGSTSQLYGPPPTAAQPAQQELPSEEQAIKNKLLELGFPDGQELNSLPRFFKGQPVEELNLDKLTELGNMLGMRSAIGKYIARSVASIKAKASGAQIQ